MTFFLKNKTFYIEQIERLSADYGLPLHLLYGGALFEQLGVSHIWEEILTYLRKWKNNIPDLPEVNFDRNPENSFNEIKKLEPILYRKFFSNHDLDNLLCVLSPEKATLNLLSQHFETMYQNGNGTIYRTLKELCESTINRLVNHCN